MIRITGIVVSALMTLMAGSLCFSKTIIVPGDAATIQGGLSLSEDGDTVLVGPGVYAENISLDNLRVTLTSSSGPAETIIQPADPIYPIISFLSWKNSQPSDDKSLSAEFSGFTITGGGDSPTIHIYGPAPFTIQNNIIHGNIPEKIYDKPVILCQGESTALMITRNIFYGNYGFTCVRILAGETAIINNTFDANRSAFISSSSLVEAVNNIIVNSSGTAVDGTFLRLDYNDVWNNYADYG